MPALHGRHDELPEKEYEPLEQGEHDDEPSDEYLPAAHSLHMP